MIKKIAEVPIKEEEKKKGPISSEDQIQALLKKNPEDHLNFEEQVVYDKISSGSLLLDLTLGGGIAAGVHRATGVTEGGKTAMILSFARNFQINVDNSKVIYVKAEGRLSQEVLDRSGLDFSADKWFVLESNSYEFVLDFIRHLVRENPTEKRYFFIIDSLDALRRKDDLDKETAEAQKVAAGAVFNSDMLAKMTGYFSKKGHICFLVSQVRAEIKASQYAKGDETKKVTNASGGNAALHYPDCVFELQHRNLDDIIFENPNGNSVKERGQRVGHYCKMVLRKTPNEKTGTEVRYPIKYGRKNGTSIWKELEIVDIMLVHLGLITREGSMYEFSDFIYQKITDAGFTVEKRTKGIDNLKKIFENDGKLVDFVTAAVKETLTTTK